MSFFRLLLQNEALCRCRLLQTSKLWCVRLVNNPVHIKRFSSVGLNFSAVHQLSVGSCGFSWTRLKHGSHLQAATHQTSRSSSTEMFEADVPVNKSTDVDVAHVLREISVICDKVKELGLQPGEQWQDRSSVELVDRLRETVASVPPSGLLHVIITLPSMPEVDDFVKQLIVSEFQKSTRHLSVSQLLRVVQSRTSNDLGVDQSVYDDAMQLIQQRWVEIKSGRDIVALLYIVPDDSTQFLDRLEDRALDLCEHMSVKELYRTVYCLARRGRRNTPLLRALMYFLDRQELDLSPVHLSNLAFALGVLNVHDQGVMEKMIKAVHKVVENRTHPPDVVRHMLSSIVQSLGILRWFDKQFMDMAVERFAQLNVSLSDWVRLLHTLASVNYWPVKLGKNGLAEIVRRIASSSQVSPMQRLDAVWSCCVLDSMTVDLAASVLCPEFVAKLEGVDGVKTVSFAAKLSAINAVARHMLPGYSKPLLSDGEVDRLNQAVAAAASPSSELLRSVVEALSEIAPSEHYLQTNVVVPSGHIIDVVMLVNDRGDPQPFADNKSVPTAGISCDHCIHRIAFQMLEFSDMVSGGMTVEPSGPSLLASRCLEAAGYKVVQVSYNEFDTALPVVKRVQHLIRKIRDVIAQDSESVETRKSEVSPPALDKEIKVDTSRSSKPLEVKNAGKFMRQLLKDGSFFPSHVQQTFESSKPVEDQNVGDFLRHLLKTDSFFSSDEQPTPAGTLELSDSASILSDVSSTNEERKKTRKKKTVTINAQVDCATAAEISDTVSELSSATTNSKEVKMRLHKKKTGPGVDCASAVESGSTVSESSSLASTVAGEKTRGRRKKSAASDEIA